MSSILDALKKAERESAADRRTDAPWPMLPSPSPYRQRPSRRWWIVLGFVAVLAVSGLVVLALRRPETTQPALSVAVLPPSVRTRDGAPPPPIAAVPAPSTAVCRKNAVFPRQTPRYGASRDGNTRVEASGDGDSPAAGRATGEPICSWQAPRRRFSPSSRHPRTPPRYRSRRFRRCTPGTRRPPLHPEPAAVPATVPKQPHAETTTATGQGSAEPPDTEKTFRSDPRIDLQALVWAPDAAVRFVVINNRLIKEGGSVDNISVVKINPDDVLLAEGSDRWACPIQGPLAAVDPGSRHGRPPLLFPTVFDGIGYNIHNLI